MLQELQAAKETFGSQPGVVNIREGYRFKNGWITDEPVITIEVNEKLAMPELIERGREPLPTKFMNIGVDVQTAPIFEQLIKLGISPEKFIKVPSGPGSYQEPPNLHLKPVKEVMDLIFHVSPDSGFPNLKAFIGRTQKSLTATMYEWEPNHISSAIVKAISSGDKTLKMVTQKTGTQKAVEHMKLKLGNKFEHIWASIGRLIPSAYHIKVASRDRKEFWLSSGNWKDSNQADIDPAGDNSTSIKALNEHNREWHVIIANDTLAGLFEDYINWDFKEAQRLPLIEKPVTKDLEVLIPYNPLPKFAIQTPVAYFDPLVIKGREIEVQPLLTPDRNEEGNRMFLDYAIKIINTAKSAIYVENQSFNLLDNNDEAFELFFSALKKKQEKGIEVRIIFRDSREFGRKNIISMKALLERLKNFGFNTDYIKVQNGCHTKAIIVDPEDPQNCSVIFGSHNLTNAGALYNRDASLCIKDHEVVKYYTEIFHFDWDVLARQFIPEDAGNIMLALPDGITPAGYKRVSLFEMMNEF